MESFEDIERSVLEAAHIDVPVQAEAACTDTAHTEVENEVVDDLGIVDWGLASVEDNMVDTHRGRALDIATLRLNQR